MWVAWTRHQRASTGAWSSSHSTGRAPRRATHSSTSRSCSATWTCTGRPAASAATARSSSGVRGAQAVGGDAEGRAVEPREGAGAALDEVGVEVEGGREPPLLGAGRGAVEARAGVEDGQQRQPDPRRRRSRRDAARHLGPVGVGTAVEVVVEVVELADAGEAGFQHLDVGLRRHGLDVLRRHRQGEAVHRVPPAPEAVGAGPADLARGPPCRAGTRGNAGWAGPARRCGGSSAPGARPGRSAATRPPSTDTVTSCRQPEGVSRSSKWIGAMALSRGGSERA